MSIDIAIKVDPGDSATRIEQVTTKLRDSERQGKTAGEAMLGLAGAFKSLAAAMQQEQDALGRLGTLHEQLAVKNSGLVGSFGGLAQALQREQDLLERIRGPAREAQSDLTALIALYQKGTITSAEYVAQLKQMNDAIENTSKSSKSGGGGMFAGIGSQLGGLGAVGGLGAAAAVVYSAKEVGEVSDKYTVLENSAKRFVTAGHDVNDVLRDQRQLARDLHQDMNESMRAYQIVKEANDGLNLSYNDTIRLDKTYGEAAQLNGRSTEDLAQQMQNLRVAFETGTDASRPLRAIFKEFPDLQKQWSASLHLNENQLYNLARSGKISFEDLARAGITNTAELDKRWADQTKTMQQRWDEFKDDLERPIDLQHVADSLDPVKQAAKAIEQQAEDLKNGTGAWAALGKAEHEAADGMLTDIEAVTAAVGTLSVKIGQALGKDAWNNDPHKMQLTLPGTHQVFAPGHPGGVEDVPNTIELQQGTEAAMKYADAVGEAKRALADLNAASASMNPLTYRSQRDSLLAVINGELPEYYKQLEQIQDPQRIYNESVAALNELLKEGRISWGEWEMQLEKASAAFGTLTENQKTWMQVQRDLDPGLAGKDAVDHAAKAAEDLKKLGTDMREATLKQQHATGEELTKQWHAQIEAIDKDIEDTKANAKTVLDPMKQSLADLITTGPRTAREFNDIFKTMFSGIESGVVGKVLDKGENGLLDAAFGQTSKQLAQDSQLTTAMATGGTAAGATIAEQMTAAGYAVASAIGSAMAAGGAGGATAAGLGGLVFGTAASAGTESIGPLGTSDLPTGDISSTARTAPGGRMPPSFIPAGNAAFAAGGGGGAQRSVTHNNYFYDRNAIISNRSDDERFLATARRYPSAFRALRGL